MVEIRRYEKNDEAALFELMQREGGEWSCYYGRENKERYKTALLNSVTYVADEGGALCGYCRCRNDDGFGVYIYDLLVDKEQRGKQIGQQLMERVKLDFPEDIVYVMSDVDEYYSKSGYAREGSIFVVDFRKKK